MKANTPLRAVRAYCVEFCCCGNTVEARLCSSEDCHLYSFRMGKGRVKLKDIRKKCLNCSDSKYYDVRNCIFNGIDDILCILYPYRLGKRPKKA